jgi:hypothetical protein
MLTIINGYNTIDETGRFDVVMFGTNIYGEMNGGFQKEIANKYPYVREENIKQPYGDLRRLGTRLTIHKGDDPIFTILYMCAKAKGSRINGFYKDSYIHALQTANNEFRGMRVVCPIIGSSNWDGKQDKMEMLPLLEEYTPDLNVFIFETIKNKL